MAKFFTKSACVTIIIEKIKIQNIKILEILFDNKFLRIILFY